MSTERWSDSGFSLQARETLSALCDGETGADGLQGVLAAWRDPAARAATCEVWHAYHLIGDVMRSDDLAGCGRDDTFLSRLRERLADEPVVVAPSAATPVEAALEPAVRAGNGVMAVRARRRSWTAPVATAAGVMAVAGVLVVTRLSDPSVLPGAGATLVQAPAAPVVATAAAPGPAPVAARPSGAEQIVVTANGPLVRDARLQQYLAAHRQFGGSSALGVPSGFLRDATYEGPTR